MVILITVPSQQCQICPVFTGFIKQISAAYYQHDKEKSKKKTYFLIIEYGQTTHEIIVSLRVQSAPALVIFKAGSKQPVLLDDPLSKPLVTWIKQELGFVVTIDPSSVDISQVAGPPEGMDQNASGNRYVGGLISFVLRAGSVFILLALVYSIFMSWWTWKRFFGVFCFVSYVLCVGGTIYCILNDSPFWYDRGDKLLIFYPQFNQQFWLEGFMAGTVMITFALSIVFLHDYAPSIENAILRHFCSISSILTAFTMATTLVMFFTWKNEYYLSETVLGPYLAKIRDLLK